MNDCRPAHNCLCHNNLLSLRDWFMFSSRCSYCTKYCFLIIKQVTHFPVDWSMAFYQHLVVKTTCPDKITAMNFTVFLVILLNPVWISFIQIIRVWHHSPSIKILLKYMFIEIPFDFIHKKFFNSNV